MSDNEYTPTTEHVRAQYARQENYDEFYEGDLYDTPDGQVSAAEFDRWLAAHDREVAAKALTDAADAWQHGQWADAPRRPDRVQERLANAQHVTDWLRARAAALGVPEETEQADTRWNGIPIEAMRGTAIVADEPRFPHYWARDLIGERIPVVRVNLDGATQLGGIDFLDDRDGRGWEKVTDGGSPRFGHGSVEIVPDSFVAAVPGGESNDAT